jgi:hypothetical protein
MNAQALIANPFLNWDHDDGENRTPVGDFCLNVKDWMLSQGVDASVQFTIDGTTVWLNIYRLGEVVLTTRFITEEYKAKRRYCLNTRVLRTVNLDVFQVEDAIDAVFPL